ncbi:MAG: FkbM family methyltransferase [Candidatus Korobacteraceae bacterium]
MSMRATLELLSRNVVFKRSLPSEFDKTPIFVSPDCGLRYLGSLRKIDPTLLALTRHFVKPGNVVWDIGANLGLFSFAAAHCTGKNGFVLAVEPDPWLIGLLQRSNDLRPKANASVTPVQAAVCNHIGTVTFHIARRARASSYIDGMGKSQTGGSRCELQVTATTLDSLLERFPAPDVIKIDVEKAECIALSGGVRLLKEVRPVVYCEVADENKTWIRDLFQKLEYDLFDPDDLKPIEQALYNTLAIPRARKHASAANLGDMPPNGSEV